MVGEGSLIVSLSAWLADRSDEWAWLGRWGERVACDSASGIVPIFFELCISAACHLSEGGHRSHPNLRELDKVFGACNPLERSETLPYSRLAHYPVRAVVEARNEGRKQFYRETMDRRKEPSQTPVLSVSSSVPSAAVAVQIIAPGCVATIR